MTTTSKPPAVYAAISAVMGIMSKQGISKDRRNQQQSYQFRGIDDVYNALSSVLADNKLVILPFVQDMRREERTTAKGGSLNYTILTVDFTLVSAEDGSQALVRTIGEAMDSADKSANKAQSAALKYAALQVFMIPTEGDNDADATTHELAPAAIDDNQWAELVQMIEASRADVQAFCKAYKIGSVKELPAQHFARAKTQLGKKLAAMVEEKPATNFGEILDDEIPGFDK